MLALLAKEFRALRPVLIFIVCFELVGVVALAWTEFPDRLTLVQQLTRESGASDLAFSLTLISLVLCAGLLVRERDAGTLAFLDGLPVTRTRIFFAKLLAALTVLGGVVLLEASFGAVLHVLSRDSLAPAFPWALLGTLIGIHAVLAFTFVGVALALSFLRQWMFLALALLVWGFILARQFQVPHVDLFNPLTLATPTVQEGRWIVPRPSVWAQLGLGAAGVASALLGFHWLGEGAGATTRRVARSLPVRLLAGAGRVLIPVAWIGVFAWLALHQPGRDDWNPAARDPATTTATLRYTFLHRQSQAAAIDALAGRGAEIQEKVAGFLGTEPMPITVDTTSSLARHNAGQAYWRKVKMMLEDDDPEQNAAVLGHETTHVFIDLLSDQRLSAAFSSARFFHEGLASYVEHRFFRDAERLRDFRRMGAVAHAWEPVAFEKLADDDAFRRERDQNLVYPLGEIFCAAIVQLHGDAALGQIVRAFARPGAPKGLEHLELWQDTLQACGFSLEAVLAEFRRQLDALVAAERPFIDALPRPEAEVEFTATEIVIRPRPIDRRPGALVCVARPAADAAEYELDVLTRGSDGAFRLPRAGYQRGTFWYQLGWRTPDASHLLLDRWREVEIER